MPYLIYLKSRRKFNNFRRKLVFTPFVLQNFTFVKEELFISWDLTFLIKKNGKTSEKVFFWQKKNIRFFPFPARF